MMQKRIFIIVASLLSFPIWGDGNGNTQNGSIHDNVVVGVDAGATSTSTTSNTNTNTATNTTNTNTVVSPSNTANAVTNNPNSTQVSIVDESVYLSEDQWTALALTFPNGFNCFKGTQGGGGDDGSNVFFGIHLLNNDCWLHSIAVQERDIGIRARLLCGSKKYRDAVAYDLPRDERQGECVRMVAESYTTLISMETREAIEATGGDRPTPYQNRAELETLLEQINNGSSDAYVSQEVIRRIFEDAQAK